MFFFLKAKLKKIKEKYGEQDEEQRQMKMEILAVGFVSGTFDFTRRIKSKIK